MSKEDIGETVEIECRGIEYEADFALLVYFLQIFTSEKLERKNKSHICKLIKRHDLYDEMFLKGISKKWQRKKH